MKLKDNFMMSLLEYEYPNLRGKWDTYIMAVLPRSSWHYRFGFAILPLSSWILVHWVPTHTSSAKSNPPTDCASGLLMSLRVDSLRIRISSGGFSDPSFVSGVIRGFFSWLVVLASFALTFASLFS